MNKLMAVALSLSILLTATGCSKKFSEPKASEDSQTIQTPTVIPTPQTGNETNPQANLGTNNQVNTKTNNQTDTPSKNKKENTSGESPELVIKTKNQISNQQADTVLNDVDKQLTELLDTLNQLDDVNQKELQY